MFRRFVSASMLMMFAGGVSGFAQEIQVVTGTYGGNCGQPHGNRSAHLASTCNGRADCNYKVEYTVLGDVAVGCQKNYVAEWRCGNSSEIFRAVLAPEAGYGSVAHLVCQGSAPEGPQERIRVISATYGANCRTPRGNATNALSSPCNGRADCRYKVDYTVLGDPAVGCRKNFEAEWACGEGSEVFRTSAPPEAGYGSVVNLRCAGTRTADVLGGGAGQNPWHPGPATIKVVAGTYGASCGQPRGNKTTHLASECNGRGECRYKVDVSVIGDPAVGCGKDYTAEWRCGNDSQVFRVGATPEAGFGSVITLSCPQ